jgi:VanZ family protein
MKPRIYFFLFLGWFLTILVLSVIPDNTPDKIHVQGFEMRLDYLMHFGVYFPLGFLLKKSALSLRPWLFVVLMLGVAALPESLQLFIPYRTFNPNDLMFNVLGAVSGYLFASLKWLRTL